MSDYIKREDAIKAFDPLQRRDWYTPWIVETLKDLPSADVAPVRHGQWININEYPYERCSICGETHDTVRCLDNYCPNCGARMDGENDEID